MMCISHSVMEGQRHNNPLTRVAFVYHGQKGMSSHETDLVSIRNLILHSIFVIVYCKIGGTLTFFSLYCIVPKTKRFRSVHDRIQKSRPTPKRHPRLGRADAMSLRERQREIWLCVYHRPRVRANSSHDREERLIPDRSDRMSAERPRSSHSNKFEYQSRGKRAAR